MSRPAAQRPIDSATTALFLVLPPLLWSTMIVVGRAVVGFVPPAALTFWTWLIAAIVLLPFGGRALVRERRVAGEQLPVLALYALLGVAGFQGLYYAGLEHTTAINASLLSPTLPIMVAVVARFVIAERLTPAQFLGIVVGLFGAVWIAARGNPGLLMRLELSMGDALILAANLSMAFYTVLLRKVPPRLPPAAFMTSLALLGSLMLAPCYALEAVAGRTMDATAPRLLALLYIGAITYALPYVFWNLAVHRAGATVTALFLYLIPVFGTILAIAWLGEALAPYHGAGVLVIAAGVYLALRTPEPPAPVNQQRSDAGQRDA